MHWELLSNKLISIITTKESYQRVRLLYLLYIHMFMFVFRNKDLSELLCCFGFIAIG